MLKNTIRNAIGITAGLMFLAGSAGAAGPDPDRHIVAFKPGAKARGAAAISAAGGRIEAHIHGVEAVAAKLPAAALKALQGNPNVAYVEEDTPRYPLSHSSGETSPYGIAMVQADLLSDSNIGTRMVCIIDSGYSRDHEDLPTSNVTGVNDSGTGNWFEDRSGHGTHVAGTIAALHNDKGVVGVTGSGALKLHIIKVFGDDGTWTYSSSLVTAANRCRDAGANVISMSLGGGRGSKTEENAFNSLYSTNGILSVAAAGNAGSTAKSYPASYASVVSVAAVDSNEVVADFSQKNDAVELAAPGVGVLSTVPMGTGQATALTVGGSGYPAIAMDGSPFTSGEGNLVDCGLGTSTCPGATGKVCLIERGEISFADKVLACQNGGGTAALIYNNTDGDLYGTLGGTATNIPSAGLTRAVGLELKGTKLGSHSTLAISASNYDAWDGTSMATPHVSGVAALVWSYNPSWTNAQIRDALQKSAKDKGAGGKDNSYGYGIVQAQAALDYLTGGEPPPPPPPPPPGEDDTDPPVISDVTATKLNGNKFKISWTTNEPATSTVTFSTGQTFSSSTLTTSHSMSFNGSRGATYTYYVSSADAAGNTSTSGPHTHQN
jgi:serine protease